MTVKKPPTLRGRFENKMESTRQLEPSIEDDLRGKNIVLDLIRDIKILQGQFEENIG